MKYSKMCVGVASLLMAATVGLWPVSAAAMNKAELIEAIASESGLAPSDAELVLQGFTDITTAILQKRGIIALDGFGTLRIAEHGAKADGCGVEAEVEFVASSSFRSGENPLYEGNQTAGENPLFVEGVRGPNNGSLIVLGTSEGLFTTGDEVIVLEQVEGVIHRDIAARGVVAGVLVFSEDAGNPLQLGVVDSAEGDTIEGLLLRGIEKSDIRRGMVVAGLVPAFTDGDCPDADAIVRDDGLLELLRARLAFEKETLAAAYDALLGTIVKVINTGEEVDIEGFGSFHEAFELRLAAHEAAHVVQQRHGRNPQTGKEIKISAKGVSYADMEFLGQMAAVVARAGLSPQPGRDLKIGGKTVVKFKAGAELAKKVN